MGSCIESNVNYLKAPSDEEELDESNNWSCQVFDFADDLIETPSKEVFKEYPYVKVRDYDSIKLSPREYNRYLTDRIIEVCSSSLTRSPRPGKYILATSNLSRKGLVNIDIMGFHKYLHHIDLSRNQLTNVDALSHLPFLTCLDVSHNLLDSLLNFKPPINLSYVNYSFNLIDEMIDLSNFWSLWYLDISHNIITKITGLDSLKYLKYLDLSWNLITKLENINNLSLETLYVDSNQIFEYEKDYYCGLSTNFLLKHISISNNFLTTLELFDGVTHAEVINVSNNNVSHLHELLNFHRIQNLMNLDISDNPVCDNPRFIEVCYSVINYLRILNGKVVDVELKGQFVYKYYNLAKCKTSGVNRSMLEIAKNIRPPKIDSTIIPFYQKTVTLLIVVGPMGSRKKICINELYQEHHHKFVKLGISHTNRPKCNHETNGKDYHFVSNEEFDKLVIEGKFLSVCQKYGYYYAISYDEIRKISESPGILVLHMDITGALILRSSYPNSKLVLAIAKSEDIYKKWLYLKYECTPWLQQYLNSFILKRKPLLPIYDDDIPKNIVSEFIKYVSKNSYEFAEEGDYTDMSNYFDNVSISYNSTAKSSDEKFERKPYEEKAVSFSVNEPIDSETTLTGDTVFTPFAISENKEGNVTLQETFPSKEFPFSPDISLTPSISKSSSSYSNEIIKFVYLPNADYLNAEIETVQPKRDQSVSRDAIMNDDIDTYVLTALLEHTSDPSTRTVSFVSSLDMPITRCASDLLKKKDSLQFLLCAPSQAITTTGFAEQEALDYFILTQFSKRQTYLDMYENDPGFFYTMIYTDHEEEALNIMKESIRIALLMQMNNDKKPFENDLICKEMRQSKLDKMFDIMK